MFQGAYIYRSIFCLIALGYFVQCGSILDSYETPNSGSDAPLKLAYVQLEPDGNTNIYILQDSSNTPIRLTNSFSVNTTPAWSPDGQRIAFCSDREHPGGYDIYVMNGDGANQVRLTTGPGSDVEPIWSPDGNRIAFLSDRDGPSRVYIMNADGTDQRALAPRSSLRPSWSPDGNRLAIVMEEAGGYGIYSVRVDGSHLRRLSAPPPTYDQDPVWSSQGDRIVYQSIINQIPLIYMVRPDRGNRAQLTPLPWSAGFVLSPDGRKVAFLGPAGIFVTNVNGTRLTLLVQSDEFTAPLCWSPDSASLVVSNQGRLYRARLGERQLELLSGENTFAYRPSWATR